MRHEHENEHGGHRHGGPQDDRGFAGHFADDADEQGHQGDEGRGPRGGGRRGPRGGGRRGPGGFGPGWGPGFGPFGPGGPGGPGGRRRGGPFGRPGGWQQADLPAADDVAGWFAGRLPSNWFVGTPVVNVDREEIIVIGELPPVDHQDGDETSAAAAQGRISRFREDSRDERVAIALEAEGRYGRKVGWGATIGDESAIFTHQAIPVMTRLRQPQRQVLDTLVDAGVARSRSEALAWAVTLVGQHTDEWLQGLRDAMAEVDKLRTDGPQV